MTYYCKKIDHDIGLDGNTDKQEWQAVEAVELVETVTGNRPVLPTGARLLWNDNFLYIGFTCQDDYINASLTRYNDMLYEEEVVEVFIDPTGENHRIPGGGRSYIEIEVNPLNALLHYMIYKNSGSVSAFGKIGSSIKTAVLRNGSNENWSVEIAVPFAEFVTAGSAKPQKGDKWLMNLYRIDRPKNGQDEYTAWNPTGEINFHRPECFGELVFE